MGWARYYAQWLKLAFLRPLNTADFIAGFVGLLIPLFAKVIPSMRNMIDLAWQLPLGILAMVWVVRLFASPFLMFRQIEQERDELLAESQQPSPSYIFIIENMESQGFNSSSSTLTIPVGITVTPTMLVEGIRLRLLV